MVANELKFNYILRTIIIVIPDPGDPAIGAADDGWLVDLPGLVLLPLRRPQPLRMLHRHRESKLFY